MIFTLLVLFTDGSQRQVWSHRNEAYEDDHCKLPFLLPHWKNRDGVAIDVLR